MAETEVADTVGRETGTKAIPSLLSSMVEDETAVGTLGAALRGVGALLLMVPNESATGISSTEESVPTDETDEIGP